MDEQARTFVNCSTFKQSLLSVISSLSEASNEEKTKIQPSKNLASNRNSEFDLIMVTLTTLGGILTVHAIIKEGKQPGKSCYTTSVQKIGVIINSTELYLNIQFLKKNTTMIANISNIYQNLKTSERFSLFFVAERFFRVRVTLTRWFSLVKK